MGALVGFLLAGRCLAAGPDSIMSWGYDANGQVSDTRGGSDFVAIAGGGYHSLALSVPAPVPELINYQCGLDESAGGPLDGVAEDLTFRFYDDEAAGNLLVTVEPKSVQVTQAVFNVLIGSGTVTAGTESKLRNVFQNNRTVWMSTEVGTDGEMTPRKRIALVAYALQAGTSADLSKIIPRSTAPSNPTEGMVYWDATTHKLMAYDGTTWQACW